MLFSYLRFPLTRWRTYLLRLISAIIVVLLIAAAYKTWRLYTIGQVIIADVQSLQTITTSDFAPTTVEPTGRLLNKIRRDVMLLRAEAAPLFPLTRFLGWVPVYGADIAAVEPLLDGAVSLSIAADETFTALAPALIERTPDQPVHIAVLRHLVPPPPELAHARTAIGQVLDARARIPLADLSPWLRDRVRILDTLLPLARDALDLAPIVPDMVGANGSRDYLFIAQNPDELRATGGLIGAAGILRFESGRIADFSLHHSGSINNFAASPYPDPPEPLRRYMHIELWAFQDANWSPDFPTTAEAAIDLYRRGQGNEVDGVIAVTPEAARILLATLGPVSVADAPEPVSAENLTPYLRREFNLELAADSGAARKVYLGLLAEAIIAKIETNLDQVNGIALAQAFQRALDERHILLYTRKPDAAAFLSQRGWDGSIQPGAADFWMVVDSNMGYNKVNPHIEQNMTYTVDLRNPATPIATLEITHTHSLDVPGECQHLVMSTVPLRYEDLMANCYWNYLRVLIPHASELIGIGTNPVPAGWMLTGTGDNGSVTIRAGEVGTYVIGTFLVVPFGETRETMLRYRLPSGTVRQDEQGWHYQLHIQKQAGRDALPVTVNILVPTKANIRAVAPSPRHTAGPHLSFSLDLERDQIVDLTFQ